MHRLSLDVWIVWQTLSWLSSLMSRKNALLFYGTYEYFAASIKKSVGSLIKKKGNFLLLSTSVFGLASHYIWLDLIKPLYICLDLIKKSSLYFSFIIYYKITLHYKLSFCGEANDLDTIHLSMFFFLNVNIFMATLLTDDNKINH